MDKMDLRVGFTIEAPRVTVPWESTEADVELLMRPNVKRVTSRYLTAPVETLGGLRCRLGFHFDAARDVLEWLEFFHDRDSCPPMQQSFDDFQSHLEHTFGTPTTSYARGPAGFPSHRWLFSGIEILHFVYERFGPEEHVHIRRFFTTPHQSR